MSLPAALSLIPKVAIFLLLVVGGFIVYELSTLFRSKLPKKRKKILEENPVLLQPLKFPHVPHNLLKKTPVSSNKPLTAKQLIKRLIPVLILGGIGGIVYY
ncbi:hypothetical protein HY469_03160, partial [Candidatus Roizmanbacteria bacterium]|nr:hypothetical protein [Candidatus Roizmanbacteria bacterium]